MNPSNEDRLRRLNAIEKKLGAPLTRGPGGPSDAEWQRRLDDNRRRHAMKSLEARLEQIHEPKIAVVITSPNVDRYAVGQTASLPASTASLYLRMGLACPPDSYRAQTIANRMALA